MRMNLPTKDQQTTLHKSAQDVEQREYTVKSMYIPKEFGTRTGQKRVFLTNKGLRVFDVNTEGK